MLPGTEPKLNILSHSSTIKVWISLRLKRFGSRAVNGIKELHTFFPNTKNSSWSSNDDVRFFFQLVKLGIG